MRRSSERGGALVEAVFAIPVLAVVLFGTIDFGRLFYKTMAVTQAARAGAQYGSFQPGNAYDHAGMVAKARAAAGDDILLTSLTVTANHECFCYTGGVESSMVCNSTCAGQARVYVVVTASAPFTTVVNYPGIPHTVPMVRTARMRSQ